MDSLIRSAAAVNHTLMSLNIWKRKEGPKLFFNYLFCFVTRIYKAELSLIVCWSNANRKRAVNNDLHALTSGLNCSPVNALLPYPQALCGLILLARYEIRVIKWLLWPISSLRALSR